MAKEQDCAWPVQAQEMVQYLGLHRESGQGRDTTRYPVHTTSLACRQDLQQRRSHRFCAREGGSGPVRAEHSDVVDIADYAA